MNIQFIVISLNEDRRRRIEQQFKELNVPFPIHYLQASTPDTSQSYINKNKQSPDIIKHMCCDLSHLRAIEYAGLDSSPEYSVIFEDDVALHKTAFIDAVKELATHWDNTKSMVSLGWVPCSNYESYVPAKSIYTLKSSPKHKIIRDRCIVGLQAYMLKRDTAKTTANTILKGTYDEYNTYCNTILKKNETFHAFDVFIHIHLEISFIFPPLAIEQDIPSTLGHKNELEYWPRFFKGYEQVRDEYWSSINYNLQIIVNYSNKIPKSVQQFKDLNIPFPIHFTSDSHSAIAYAGLEASPTFSLILEDTMTLHKQAFIPAVLELIKNWSSLNIKCVALGWKPTANFDSYIGGSSVYSFESSLSYRIMDDMNIGGLQAYLIPKSSVKESTLSSTYVFPPLAIEHNSIEQSRFFEGYEHLRNEYYSTNVQLIVIWLTEERRVLVEQQFKELNVPFPVRYMKASSPQSVTGYLLDKHTPSQQKLSCCGHSHFRALEIAGQDASPEFTVICEDDVSLHKTLFIDAVKELSLHWKAVVGNSSPQSMVSLGWVPCYNFASYVPGKSVYKFKVSSQHDIKNDRWTVGLQSYMVHKESAKITAKKFLTETYAEYLKLANEVEKAFDVSYPIDHLLQKYLTVRYVFPPLAVDQQLESTINDGPDPGFYTIFFRNYEHLRNDYWKGASSL
jgi:GR25 family glycosyltransferase involved in LPS biosynthesis